MYLLSNIHTSVVNTVEWSWSNHISMITVTTLGPLLIYIDLIVRRHVTHTYIGPIKGEDKKIVDAASRLTHFLNQKFLRNFHCTFPQKKPWNLLPLPSRCRRQLNFGLLSKRLLKVFLPQSSINTPLPGNNVSHFAGGCTSSPTFRASGTQSISYIYFMSSYVP